MRLPTLFLLLAIFALSTFSFPHPISSLHPREDDVSPVSPVPGIVTKIYSANGSDITSNFRTLLYQGPAHIASSNLTDRDLTTRQGPSIARSIDTCKRLGHVFKYSICEYHKGHRHSMQRYKVACRVQYDPRGSGTFWLEHGVCNPDEICVDGPRTTQGQPTVASCISQANFRPMGQDNSTEGGTSIESLLGDMSVSAVVSKTDKSTPLGVKTLEIDAGVMGEGSTTAKTGPIKQDYCTNCVDVATGKLMEGTNFLRTEATVSMVGTAAAAGILWLAVLSG